MRVEQEVELVEVWFGDKLSPRRVLLKEQGVGV